MYVRARHMCTVPKGKREPDPLGTGVTGGGERPQTRAASVSQL